MDFQYGAENSASFMAKHRRFVRVKKCVGAALSLALLLLYFSAPMRALRALPDTLYASDASDARLLARALPPAGRAVTVGAAGGERLSDVTDATVVTYRLFGVLPLKSVTVLRSGETLLTPGGSAVGITIHTRGVLVVGLGSVETAGGPQSPGAAAGLAAGDVLLAVNGTEVDSAEALTRLCKAASAPLRLTVSRGGEARAVEVTPVRAAGGAMQLGLWVRDSTAGVGTLSFYEPQTGFFAALGHPVSDVDTRTVLDVRAGKLLASRVADVVRGEEGEPGELVGVFAPGGAAMGEIRTNGDYGIYGAMLDGYENPLTGSVPLARASEARTGEATLLTTVSDAGIEAFTCEIVRVSAQTAPAAKGMVVQMTDERLLARTGGIVQGMSGSPVIQDGKLVGVVTHVFVNDPTRGYCVYAEWMLNAVWESAGG